MFCNASGSCNPALYKKKKRYFFNKQLYRLFLFGTCGVAITLILSIFIKDILSYGWFLAAPYFLFGLLCLFTSYGFTLVTTKKAGLCHTPYQLTFYDSNFIILYEHSQTHKKCELQFEYTDISHLVLFPNEYVIFTKSYYILPIDRSTFDPLMDQEWLAYIMEHNIRIDLYDLSSRTFLKNHS